MLREFLKDETMTHSNIKMSMSPVLNNNNKKKNMYSRFYLLPKATRQVADKGHPRINHTNRSGILKRMCKRRQKLPQNLQQEEENLHGYRQK
jgi:hypothetical protein